MSNNFERKLAALQRATWFNPPDEMISVAEAASRGIESLMRFVTWWGTDDDPAPAGFTHFKFSWMTPDGDDGREWFDIVAIEYLEGEDTRTTQEQLHRDDVVLIWHQRQLKLEAGDA